MILPIIGMVSYNQQFHPGNNYYLTKTRQNEYQTTLFGVYIHNHDVCFDTTNMIYKLHE